MLTVVLPIVCVAGCGDGPTGPSATRTDKTSLSFTSDPQHYVGQGRSVTLTLETATFTPLVARSGGYVSVIVQSKNAPSTQWGFIIVAPTGSGLTPGSYTTTRFDSLSGVGMDFFGDGRGCNSATGQLVIHEIRFGAGDTLLRLRASFDHHCEGASPVLHGELTVLADPWR